MPIFNINSSAAVKFTAKLERMHKSALPGAIRGTLNKAAFDVKQNTMPESAHTTFVKRNPNFFIANSNVTMAMGYDVNTMRASVGFISSNLKYNNYAIKELEQQEYGGSIDERDYIPLDEAREGQSIKQPVRPGFRLKSIRNRVKGSLKNIIDSANGPGSGRQKFIKSAIFAGKGGYVIGNYGKRILYRIESVRKRRGQMIEIKKTKLYSVETRRRVKIKETGFMRRASNKTAGKMAMFYENEAQRQFDRLRK